MVTESADDMLFGETKNPVKLGLDQVAGGGLVYPNIKVAPAEGSEESIDGLEATSKNIAFAACQRVADVGLPAIQIEMEHVQQQSISKEASERCTAVTWEELEKLHDKFGTRVSLMSTIADMREEENGLRGSDYDVAMDESFEACAQSGASMLCIETVGGKVYQTTVYQEETQEQFSTVSVY